MSGYRDFGFRENPFGELTAEERANVAVFPEMQRVTRFLEGASRESKRAIQLMGDHGRGKSSRLYALAKYFEATVHRCSLRVPYDWSNTLAIVDEAQQSSVLFRRKLFRRCEAIALSTHQDFRSSLRRHGYRVLAIEVKGLRAQDLISILQPRINRVAASGASLRLSPDVAARMINEFGDDLRRIEAELYERVQIDGEGSGCLVRVGRGPATNG